MIDFFSGSGFIEVTYGSSYDRLGTAVFYTFDKNGNAASSSFSFVVYKE